MACRRRRLVSGVAGAGFWYLHFDFAAFAGDLRLLAAVQSFSARLASMVQLTAANLPDLWCLGGAMLIAALCLRPPATSPCFGCGCWRLRPRWRPSGF